MSEQLGPYRVLRRLGQGGMGVVDEVVHGESGARYALKRLTPAGARDPEARLRFAREAQALAALEHPHLVRVHAAELEGPAPYLVQPFLPGGSLAQRLARGPLPLDEARRVFLELASGLAHAHSRGVLHRDLKPDNVLFDEQGRAVLADFGLAHVAGAESLTTSGTLLGTPAWMAPEQARDVRASDARADVYGLGALLYALLAGRPPFESDGRSGVLALLARVQSEPPRPLLELRPDAPPDLVAVCARALEKDPARRWASAVELQEELRGAAGAPQPGRRWPWVAAAALLLLALLLAPGAWLATRGSPTPASDPVPAPSVVPPEPAPTPSDVAPGPPPPAASSPSSRAWQLRRVLDAAVHEPRACFDGDWILVWDGAELRCFPRRAGQGPPPRIEALLPARPEELVFLRRVGDDVCWSSRAEAHLGVWLTGSAGTRSLSSRAAAGVGGDARLLVVPCLVESPEEPHQESGVLVMAVPGFRCAAFGPGNVLLLGGSPSIEGRYRAGQVSSWERLDSRWVPRGAPLGHPSTIRALDVHPAGDRVVIGDSTGEVFEVAWPVTSLPTERNYVAPGPRDEFTRRRAHSHPVQGCAYLDDGSLLVTLSGDGKRGALTVWDTGTRRPVLPTFEVPHTSLHDELVCAPERDQALFMTHEQVWLLSRDP